MDTSLNEIYDDDYCIGCGHRESVHRIIVDDETGREMRECIPSCPCSTLAEP